MSCPLCSSAACVCGTEKWSDRRREWTDVTVSRCRSSQTLTHFHSAHHKRPAVFICLGAAVLAVGVWRYSGVGFHCLLFDVRPPSVCVCVCVTACMCAIVRGCIRMCGFAQRRSETSVAWQRRPLSFNHSLKFSDRNSSLSRTATLQGLLLDSVEGVFYSTAQQLFMFMDYMLTVTFRLCTWRT